MQNDRRSARKTTKKRLKAWLPECQASTLRDNITPGRSDSPRRSYLPMDELLRVTRGYRQIIWVGTLENHQVDPEDKVYHPMGVESQLQATYSMGVESQLQTTYSMGVKSQLQTTYSMGVESQLQTTYSMGVESQFIDIR